ncbi:CDP-glycerol glycerophosphotransferase family protein [Clostridium botulinum]|nr:CDP-glycerol glycerophosphotransferase family protein [Clostridium botulinum]
MKGLLYIIYSTLFYLYSIFPINDNKTTFIMTHDSSVNGNIMCMYRKVKEKKENHVCKFITKHQLKPKNKFELLYQGLKFIFITPYYLATSKTIFLDNVFLPMAYIKFKSKVKVVQLWHGCNTLKKFGQLSNTGKIKELEKKANSRYTHVIVSSKKMINLHQEAFGVDEKIIYPLGLPRMDIFFDKKRIEEEKNKFYEEYQELKYKKIILYAPTFRDNNVKNLDANMNLSDIIDKLPLNYVIINKFHPFVSNNYTKINSERIIDMSNYKDLNRLLLVSDILISDYSSIVFDFALLNKPIIFYAYDKDKYEKTIRGFYYNYEDYIKTSFTTSKTELMDQIMTQSIYIDNEQFYNKYVDYKDSEASNRIYTILY